MRVTKAAVNKALQAAGLEGVEIVNGGTYWYFDGGDTHEWYSTSVYAYRLCHLTVEQWVEAARVMSRIGYCGVAR